MSAALPLLPPALLPTNLSNVRSWRVEPLCLYGPAPCLVSSQMDRSPVTRSPFFSFLLPNTASLLNSSVSSLQGYLHRSGGNARVTDTQTGQQMETTGVPSHSSPAGGSGRSSYHQNTAAEQGGVGRPWPGGTLSITSFLFPSFCSFSLAGILHAHPLVLSSCHGGFSYMHMHTLIQLSSGIVSL